MGVSTNFYFEQLKDFSEIHYLLNVVELDHLIGLVFKQALSFLEGGVSLRRELWSTTRFNHHLSVCKKKKKKGKRKVVELSFVYLSLVPMCFLSFKLG